MAHTTAHDRLRRGKRAAVVGIACNLLLAVSKLVIGLLCGTIAVTADAVNNLFDATGAIVTLVGFKIAEKPADSEHPYGHARFEYIAGTVVAATVLFVGFELASSAVSKIWEPEGIAFSVAAIVVLIISIAVKLGLWLYNLRLSKTLASTTLKATADDARNDVFATGAVLAAMIIETATGYRLDGWIGLGVALFILYSGVMLLKETVNPLIGVAGSDTLRQEILALVTASERVVGCHDLLLHDYGPNACFASIHVEMDCHEDALQCHELLDEIEHTCLDTLGVHLVIHHDPIATDDHELLLLRRRVEGFLQRYHDRLTLHDFRMVADGDRIRLLFDVTLPDCLRNEETAIIEHVRASLDAADPDRYIPVITFDPS